MITGFNTNVRHGGRVFHVQTEDSGLKNPHVISHLYLGGTILSSQKRKYDQLLGQEGDLTPAIRGLMEEQHREMLQALKRGDFDDVISERLDDPNESTGEQPEAAVAAQGAPQPEPAAAAEADAHEFGDGIVSEKPLDEVILEYLVDKARTRTADGRPGRGSRSRE